MGQILHGSAKTTHAVRAAIQRSKASIKELAGRYDLNPKTVTKWRKRPFVHDAAMGPKAPHSTVLSAEEEALAVAFRKHTLLPLDDCLYALQATIPHLTRSSLHRLFQRHSISRLPAIEGETKQQKAFKRYPIGYFHIDIAEVRTGEGKLHLFVAIDRTSKFAFVELHEKATTAISSDFLLRLIAAVPDKIVPISRVPGPAIHAEKGRLRLSDTALDQIQWRAEDGRLLGAAVPSNGTSGPVHTNGKHRP
jgi:transposase-like protein